MFEEEIDPRSPVPLYEQIAAKVRLAVASGDFVAGQPLPSVRNLAMSLRVNPATVVQAYRELEREGFVELRHGTGTFVQAVPPARRKHERTRGAQDMVRRLIAEGAKAGIAAMELKHALDEEVRAAHG